MQFTTTSAYVLEANATGRKRAKNQHIFFEFRKITSNPKHNKKKLIVDDKENADPFIKILVYNAFIYNTQFIKHL